MRHVSTNYREEFDKLLVCKVIPVYKVNNGCGVEAEVPNSIPGRLGIFSFSLGLEIREMVEQNLVSVPNIHGLISNPFEMHFSWRHIYC